MSPEKIIIDPVAAPFVMGMVVKIKDFVVLKALTAAVIMAFSVGIFYNQTNALIKEQAKSTVEFEALKEEVIALRRDLAITNNNVAHIRDDMDKLTARVGEIISFRAKIRK
ncbi:hypothetical protein KAR91_28595 [Candidatus Pacearchaeota archaeon]|nr:hypothetical protein [Candidatus Pacearchaeota archaeon]